jgi:signal transduction histidine kinase/ligand-binding sensor domain-containing protein/DNA-binding response OmpR family regulator
MTKCYKILILIILFITHLNSQDQNINFKNISIEHGLSQSWVTQIVQDQQGFLWIGTQSGLNRYDGYNFKVYNTIPGDTNSLSNNNIMSLLVDRKNILWIGTSDGLNSYDIKNNKFAVFINDPDNQNSISDNYIWDMSEDKKGNIWIGTNRGLNKYDNKKNMFVRYKYSDKTYDYYHSGIRSVLADSRNNIWVGTGSGLYLMLEEDYKNDTSSYYNIDDIKFRFIPLVKIRKDMDVIVNKLYEDRSGVIWIGCAGAPGLYRYDRNVENLDGPNIKLGFMKAFRHIGVNSIFQDKTGSLWIGSGGLGLMHFDEKADSIISRQDIICDEIFEDQSGVLWVSGAADGLKKYDRENQQFPPPTKYGSTGVLVDKKGNLWLSDTEDIHKYNQNSGQYIHYRTAPGESDNISTIHEDKRGIIWVGSWDPYHFDPIMNRFNPIPIDYKQSNNLPKQYGDLLFSHCNIIYSDKNDNLWLGARNGLYKYNYDTKALIRYSYDASNSKSLSHNTIWAIYQDSQSTLWVGTLRGLNKFDAQSETFTRYLKDPLNPNSISDNDISFIHESQVEKNGPLWIGTNSGLNKFDRENEVFIHYTINDGLPHNGIQAILEDDNGNLWISTYNGLSKFNPKTKIFRNYYKSDGLQGNFFTLSSFKNKKGEMYFGGYGGLSVFHPDSIIDDSQIPPIVINRFKKYNKEVKLDTAISYIKQITLGYDEKAFSFEFAALNYTNPEKNQFTYMMEGFDKDWVYTGYKHDATYTNLSPGEYVFRVKGSNHDGVWNEEGTSIRIIITPPWWKTTWAYAAYILLFATTLYALRNYDRKRQRLKHELEMEHVHAEKLEEMDRIKSRFFANISHEFRTPLTLILGPIEKLRKKIRDKTLKQDLDIMKRNASRLQGLINQLLDLSKLESGKMALQTRRMDIVQHLKTLAMSFTSFAETKQIILKFKAKPESITAYIDVDKIDKIFTNLLSNAFKFTPHGGKISAEICTGEAFSSKNLNSPEMFIGNASPQPSEIVHITITNSGPGIPAHKIDKIFDRFYQLDDSYTREQEGTGIGLALTKELVNLHHGEISVESTPNEKTTFTVQLPLGKDHLKKEEIIDEEIIEEISLQIPDPESRISHHESHIPHPTSKTQCPLLLIVEDNPDMRQFICDRLESEYRILEAENGEKGFKTAIDKIPDLVISDVMMPKMDGFEFCGKLKTDQRTSHIPVVLLTARAEIKDKIEGLETGADDYIAKPFNADELAVRIRNLIEQRRKLRERFTQLAKLQPKDIAVTSTDEKFIKKSIGIIEEHISDPDFSVTQFSQEIGISRSQLHRKIHALTGQSVSRFICLIRLQRAVQLLGNNAGSISEIAYDVGFNSPSYFIRCFKSHFRMSPSQYINHQSEKS